MTASGPLRKYQHGQGPHWALVTGATNGMGFEWAKQLAALGFSVLLHGRNPEKLAKAKDEILSHVKQSKDIEIRPIVADASHNPPDLGEIGQALSDPSLNLRVVVNNVGITNQDYPQFETVEESNIMAMIAMNAVFPTLVARRSLEALKRNGPGLMVNVSSLGAWAPSPYLPVYGATKAYNLQFSHSLYNEMILEDAPVDVVAMIPGTVISGMNDGPPTSFMPLASVWVHSALQSLAPSSMPFFGSSRPAPVITPWSPHARGLKFLNMMPTSIGDKLTRNFVRDDKAKKQQQKP